MGLECDMKKDLCYNGCDCEDEERCQAIYRPTWNCLWWVTGACGDDVEDFGGAGGTDAVVGLLRDHFSQSLVGSGFLLWWFLFDSLVKDSKSLGLIDTVREEVQNDKI